MAKIFISYRREDGIARAGRIYDRLVSRYGEDQVFMDLGKIAAGADFEKVLDQQLGACDVLIAIIGEVWLVSRKGRRRLDDQADFVRREIERALQRNVRILPVLVGEAKMPTASELPPGLTELASRNATRISDEGFDAAMEGLILDIEDPNRAPEDTAFDRWQRLRQRVRMHREAVLTGAVIVILTALITWASVFDLFTLDTRLQTLSLWLGDIMSRPVPDDRVAIVAIDAETERLMKRKFDRSWRKEHGVLVDRLSAAGARAIAFDMYFEEPSAVDAVFADALRKAHARNTTVIVGMRTLSNGLPKVAPEVLKDVSGVGLLCVGGRLGYAVTAPLLVMAPTEQHSPSKRVGLGVLAAFGPTPAISLDETERALLAPDDVSVHEISVGIMETVKSVQRSCPALHPQDVAAQLIIRLSDLEHWRRVPVRVKYEDIVLSPMPDSSIDWKGKIVLVGVTNRSEDPDSVDDVYAVPRGVNVEYRYGVELHADVVSNVLGPKQVHSLHWAGQLLITIASVGVALLVRLFAAGLSRVLGWLLVLAALALYFYMVGLLCAKFHLLLDCVYQLWAFAVTYWLAGKLPSLTKRST